MTGKKMNNRRVYMDANHQPRQDASFRRSEALERQAVYDKLSLEQKIAKLPPEPFSAKQRAKLMAQLEKKNQVKEPLLEKASLIVEGLTKKVKNKK